MTKAYKKLEEKYYTSNPKWINGTVDYHNFITSFIQDKSTVALEIGPGPQSPSTAYVASKVAQLDGLDIDERALKNPDINKSMLYDGRLFPIEDNSYDLIVADYVMEHVEFPNVMLSEIHRVLRPGGHFIYRTPNIFHYVSLISRFTPHSFHLAVANKARQGAEGAIDPYPTFYRFNSRRSMQAIAKRASLETAAMRLIEKQPSYLQFNSLAYRCGVAYERLVNSTSALSFLRANIFGAIAKNNPK